jgi:hypothetical protein
MAFENMFFPFMALLLLMNGMFLAMSYVSVTQDNSQTLGDVWNGQQNGFVQQVGDTTMIFKNQLDNNLGIAQGPDTNTQATTDIQTKVDAFKNVLFGIPGAVMGAFGVATTVLSFFGQVLFGYIRWIDFLVNPAWGIVAMTLGLMLKTVIFLIEIIGLSAYARSFFIFRNLF